MKPSDRPNIGIELERKLELADIRTPEDLTKSGSFEALQLIDISQELSCISMLFALE